MDVTKILFTVEFTPEEVKDLRTAATHHYDGVCKVFADQIKPIVTFDWRDFDILSKICESPLAPEEISHKVWNIFRQLRGMSDIVTRRI